MCWVVCCKLMVLDGVGWCCIGVIYVKAVEGPLFVLNV